MEGPVRSLGWSNCYRFQFDVGLENIKTGWKEVSLSKLERITRIIVGFLELFPVVTIPLAMLDNKFFFKNRLVITKKVEAPKALSLNNIQSSLPLVIKNSQDLLPVLASSKNQEVKPNTSSVSNVPLAKLEENGKSTWVKIVAIVLLAIFTGGVVFKTYNYLNSAVEDDKIGTDGSSDGDGEAGGVDVNNDPQNVDLAKLLIKPSIVKPSSELPVDPNSDLNDQSKTTNLENTATDVNQGKVEVQSDYLNTTLKHTEQNDEFSVDPSYRYVSSPQNPHLVVIPKNDGTGKINADGTVHVEGFHF